MGGLANCPPNVQPVGSPNERNEMNNIESLQNKVGMELYANPCKIDADDFALVCRAWRDDLCYTWVVHRHELWGMNEQDIVIYIVDTFRSLFGRVGV